MRTISISGIPQGPTFSTALEAINWVSPRESVALRELAEFCGQVVNDIKWSDEELWLGLESGAWLAFSIDQGVVIWKVYGSIPADRALVFERAEPTVRLRYWFRHGTRTWKRRNVAHRIKFKVFERVQAKQSRVFVQASDDVFLQLSVHIRKNRPNMLHWFYYDGAYEGDQT